MSWFKFRNLYAIVNCVAKSLNKKIAINPNLNLNCCLCSHCSHSSHCSHCSHGSHYSHCSLCSHVLQSLLSLKTLKSKGVTLWLTDSLTHWMTRSPIELSLTAKRSFLLNFILYYILIHSIKPESPNMGCGECDQSAKMRLRNPSLIENCTSDRDLRIHSVKPGGRVGGECDQSAKRIKWNSSFTEKWTWSKYGWRGMTSVPCKNDDKNF